VAAKPTHRERLAALMEWAHENVRPQYAAPGRVVPDNFIDIARRGYGYCDQSAHVFATLAHFAGYDVHLLFLRRADGVSPHTVTEVRIDDRWVLVDPWLGFLFLDRAGRLAGTADLGTTAALPRGYALLGAAIDEGHFQRGTRFETFPYQSLSGFLLTIWRRVAGVPAVETPTGPPTIPSAAGTAVSDPATLRAELLQMDEARRAHLEGRYDQAIAAYRELLVQAIPADMAESVRFFLGLALLRAGSPRQAALAFDSALDATPGTAWRSSVLYYRGEAKLQAGDVDGAVTDLREANIPSAAQKLVELGRGDRT
jgi:hypothetical protein